MTRNEETRIFRVAFDAGFEAACFYYERYFSGGHESADAPQIDEFRVLRRRLGLGDYFGGELHNSTGDKEASEREILPGDGECGFDIAHDRSAFPEDERR